MASAQRACSDIKTMKTSGEAQWQWDFRKDFCRMKLFRMPCHLEERQHFPFRSDINMKLTANLHRWACSFSKSAAQAKSKVHPSRQEDAKGSRAGFWKPEVLREVTKQEASPERQPSTPKNKAEYFAEWVTWANAGAASEPNRAEAAARMIECFRDGSAELDVRGLGLTSLPQNLPPSLERVLVSPRKTE